MRKSAKENEKEEERIDRDRNSGKLKERGIGS
jgi:hypothetical protein